MIDRTQLFADAELAILRGDTDMDLYRDPQPQTLRQRLAAWWDEMEPQTSSFSDEQLIEREDGLGVGPGRCFTFEGFGLHFTIFYGRMPGKREEG